MPRHSLSLGIGALTLADMGALAKQAERSGFATVWTNDFYTHGAFIPLAAIATGTSRIALGTGIAYAFARSPLVTALTARDLDELSAGRLVLGLGSGTKSMNERWHSLPFAHPAPRMRECVEAIRALWQLPKTGHARYQGRFYQVDLAVAEAVPPPLRDTIPIYVAGVNSRMVRTAGEVADGLVGHPLATVEYLRSVARPALKEGAALVGRPAPGPVASYVITAVHADRDRARREAAHQIAFYTTVKTYDVILDLHGFQREKDAIRAAFRGGDREGMVAAVSGEMVDAMAIAGNAADCRRQLERYAGVIDEVILYSPSYALSRERVIENLESIIRAFAA